ncbi:MAG: ABC transporter permease [Lachnospiraceae bacterium]|nr:ABC transporter permease [Lachnospiraceae bacterium]
MTTTIAMVKRNMKLYLRDKTSVFFSMLTILIIIALNICFLSKTNIDSLNDMLPGRSAEAKSLIYALVFAGISYTATVTVPLGVLSTMVSDQDHFKMKAFFTSPASRISFVLGYLGSTILAGITLSFLTFFLSLILLYVLCGVTLSISTVTLILGYLIINVLCNSCLVFFMTSFIKTQGSYTALNIIVGTLIGFLSGIYLPIGMLPKAVQSVLRVLPSMHGSTLLRSAFSKDLTADFFHGADASIIADYKNYMGITISINGHTLTNTALFLILTISGILFLIGSVIITEKKHASDR